MASRGLFNDVDNLSFGFACSIFYKNFCARIFGESFFLHDAAVHALLLVACYFGLQRWYRNISSGAFFLLLEELAAMAVLFQKSYTNYRAFQVVGSLFLIILGFIFYYADVSKNLLGVERLGGDKIFLAAVVLFWILSRAHILFRDKLLDYLESRENEDLFYGNLRHGNGQHRRDA